MSEDPVPYSARRPDSRGGGGWVPAAEIDAAPAEIHSVGSVVSESAEALVLAASVEQRGYGGQHVLDPLTILLSAVVERRPLRLAD